MLKEREARKVSGRVSLDEVALEREEIAAEGSIVAPLSVGGLPTSYSAP